MFITQPDFTIEDFVKACGMIAPPGTNINMIISPKPINLPEGSGFSPEVPIKDVPEDESIVYQRTDPIMKQTAGQTPPDYAVWETEKLGRTIPTPTPTPPITDPESLPSPFIKVLSECITFGKDVQLKEDWACFQKNTIFHCIPSKLNEDWLWKHKEYEVCSIHNGKIKILATFKYPHEAAEALERFKLKIPSHLKKEYKIIMRPKNNE